MDGHDHYTWRGNGLDRVCDIQAMYFPARDKCDKPHMMLLVIQYTDIIPDLVDVFAKKLLDFLENELLLAARSMEHVSSINGGEHGEPVSFIYFFSPQLNHAADFDVGLNNFRTAVEKLMLKLRQFDFWKRDLILCYNLDADIGIKERTSLNTVSFSTLKWLFDLCEIVSMEEKVHGGPSTSTPPDTSGLSTWPTEGNPSNGVGPGSGLSSVSFSQSTLLGCVLALSVQAFPSV